MALSNWNWRDNIFLRLKVSYPKFVPCPSRTRRRRNEPPRYCEVFEQRIVLTPAAPVMAPGVTLDAVADQATVSMDATLGWGKVVIDVLGNDQITTAFPLSTVSFTGNGASSVDVPVVPPDSTTTYHVWQTISGGSATVGGGTSVPYTISFDNFTFAYLEPYNNGSVVTAVWAGGDVTVSRNGTVVGHASSDTNQVEIYANIDTDRASPDFGKARATLHAELSPENGSDVSGLLAFQMDEFVALSGSSVSTSGNGVGNIFAGTLRVGSINATGAHATITLNSDGSVLYDIDPTYWKSSDQFAYYAGDDSGASTPANVAVTIPYSINPKINMPGLEYWIDEDSKQAGGAEDETPPGVVPGYLLVGGGAPFQQPYEWLLRNAKWGDVLILETTPIGTNLTTFLTQNVMPIVTPRVDSIEVLAFDWTDINAARTAANSDIVEFKILHADAIFIEGGDQAKFLDVWRHTKVQDALNAKVGTITIGGTSAGMHVMSDVIYRSRAEIDGTTSAEAVADIYNANMVFETDDPIGTPDPKSSFLDIPLFGGMVFDTHFWQRDRMGRTIGFLARMGISRAIAADERTALLIDVAGIATVVSGPVPPVIDEEPPEQRNAYFIDGSSATYTTLLPLTETGVKVHKLSAGDQFDIATWTPVGGAGYEYRVEIGGGLPDVFGRDILLNIVESRYGGTTLISTGQ